MIDPYIYLSNIADDLWDLRQQTGGKESDQAESMYNVLENIYLEPFRHKQVQSNTKKYARLAQKLQSDIAALDASIKQITGIQDKVQQVAQYAQIFDQIIAIAARLA
jgi:hypothetical protein